MEKKALLIDFTKCIGCGSCMEACAEQNGLPPPTADMTDLSSNNFTVVKKHNNTFYRRQCMHCNDPTCASVCPVAAFTKHANGAVTYDASKCMGCRYCMEACPFKVPTYEWDKAIPKVQKCILCFERIENGERTACSWVCPTGATRFGNHNRMIELAQYLIDTNPKKYVNYIYGQNDVGGTSVLMLSGIPFEELGFPMDMGKKPLPELTGRVLHMIPSIAIAGSILMGGIWWVINRRIDLESHKTKEGETKDDKDQAFDAQ